MYLEDDVMKDEYVMNDRGKIFSGNYKQIGHKPWNFGQVSIVANFNKNIQYMIRMDHGTR